LRSLPRADAPDSLIDSHAHLLGVHPEFNVTYQFREQKNASADNERREREDHNRAQ